MLVEIISSFSTTIVGTSGIFGGAGTVEEADSFRCRMHSKISEKILYSSVDLVSSQEISLIVIPLFH